MIYDNHNLDWLWDAELLLKNSGIMIVQTDYHTLKDVLVEMGEIFGDYNFVNHCIYINDWGGVPKKGFPQKHDDILIFSKGRNWKWNKDVVQISKKTAGTVFDKKGTGLKTSPNVFYDHVSFSTVSNERIKMNGKNIQWQKPLWLMDRLVAPFTSELLQVCRQCYLYS